ncbi:NAD-P-binding protein [Epithele typhae]|uniref:NAD-P-binding protein n=1 Tax=Epithele typhae TaxID=378194 RepID=UPI002007A31D|nr:NAD-P-binding protein [Epithele typhae]KAH9925890.1 NAD-P-binding protein [Epithele typhae]
MATAKPLVCVVGATGVTGKSIVDGLLKSAKFSVVAFTRSSSSPKPDVETMRAKGVEIRHADLLDGVEKLKTALEGIDIVISAVTALSILDQKDLVRAAKEVGVKRFIPCDFGTPGAKGVRMLLDDKLKIHELVESLDVPHTYIDVGWWMQVYIPLPARSAASPQLKALANIVCGAGDAKLLVTNLHHIGDWVARIVDDPRTLNRSVMVWEDEVTQMEALAIAGSISGEGAAFEASRTSIDRETFEKMAFDAAAAIAADPSDFANHITQSWAEYVISTQFLRENTLENAKALGYLDAQELYPDAPSQSLEEFAKEFYALEDPGLAIAR